MCVVNVLMRCWRQECVCSEGVDKMQVTGGCTCNECVDKMLEMGVYVTVCSEHVDKLQETEVCIINMLTSFRKQKCV